MIQALSGILQHWGTLSTFWYSLSCPLHCGSSHLPWFLAGLSSGALIGFLLCLFFIHQILVAFPGFFGVSRAPRASPVPAASSPVPASHRLRAYLNE